MTTCIGASPSGSVKGQPWSFRLCILEAVREGGLELKIHNKRQACPEWVGFDGGTDTKLFRVRFLVIWYQRGTLQNLRCLAANQSAVAPGESVVRCAGTLSDSSHCRPSVAAACQRRRRVFSRVRGPGFRRMSKTTQRSPFSSEPLRAVDALAHGRRGKAGVSHEDLRGGDRGCVTEELPLSYPRGKEATGREGDRCTPPRLLTDSRGNWLLNVQPFRPSMTREQPVNRRRVRIE